MIGKKISKLSNFSHLKITCINVTHQNNLHKITCHLLTSKAVINRNRKEKNKNILHTCLIIIM